MAGNAKRPFYAEYAWAFELIIDRPVQKECDAIAAWLTARGVPPGAELLDAGCGTGRYARELARRGYAVHGIDLSQELIDVARRSIDSIDGERTSSLSYAVGDIQSVAADRYDAILCRGVLNDIVDDESRDAVLASFARALRPAGVLILDVREWETSAARKVREPVFQKRIDTHLGALTYTSTTTLDHDRRHLVVSERHTLVAQDGQERSSDYQLVMRCWTRSELTDGLAKNGFSPVSYYGAYDPSVRAGANDRLVAVAQRSKAAESLS
jgi:SAM-dependent methyltransferase